MSHSSVSSRFKRASPIVGVVVVVVGGGVSVSRRRRLSGRRGGDDDVDLNEESEFKLHHVVELGLRWKRLIVSADATDSSSTSTSDRTFC